MDNIKFGFFDFGMPENILYDFISAFPEAAHLKDINNKKYIFSNKHNLKIYGLNDPAKIIGLTVHDLDDFMRPYWGEGFSDKISELDNRIAQEQVLITDNNRVFLDKFGFVHIQNMTKAPIVNTSNKTIAILTTSFEVTGQLNYFHLFSIYKKIYPQKRKACLYFMQYLKIEKFFLEILSEKEMICFLLMAESKSYKQIADKMSISNKTVETHIRNIANKTSRKNLIEIFELLKMLQGKNVDEKTSF